MAWDDLFLGDLASKARKWFKELEDLPTIKAPRCLGLGQEEEMLSQTLYTFVDASQDASGVVVYSRATYKSGAVSIRFVAAKWRVAPLAATSIPRLELMAAVLGLLVLGRSRLQETQNSGDTFQPTRIQQTYLRRGLKLSELTKNENWWTGTDFLGHEESEWPVNKVVVEQDAAKVEVKKSNSELPDHFNHLYDERAMITINQEDPSWRLNPKRFSSWKRFTRVHAWVRRFVDNCRGRARQNGELKPSEIEDTEVQVIKSAQREAFPEEYLALQRRKELPKNSKLLAFRPRLDEEGQMRCDSQLKYAEFLSHDARFPIILPRKHQVTKLIVKYFHEEGNHESGTNQTLAVLSTRFWIIYGRKEIREWEKECNECRRRKAKAAKQIMAPLPQIRLRLSLRPFPQTAVDFGGPFVTIQGRRSRRQKRYLCLFTCLATRAVHLEMAFGLDTDSFLHAFYMMVNRRGLPERCYLTMVRTLSRPRENCANWLRRWVKAKLPSQQQTKE